MKPIFIVGAPRSGNTLLRLVLSSHSGICIPPESAFLHYLWSIYLSRGPDLANIILDKLFSDHKFKNWGLNKSEVKVYIEKSIDSSYDSFLSGIYELYLKKVNKVGAQWGDKNPLYLAIIHKILKLFPQAWIIIMVREPLSIFGSLKRVNFFGRDTEIAVNEYYRRIKCVADTIIEYQDSHNLIMINYAGFVNNPERNIRSLISRLGYEFEPAMLDFHNNQSFIFEMLQSKIMFHENLMKPISDSFVSHKNYGLEQSEVDQIENKLVAELNIIRHFIANNPAI